jgi:hypothetical protein
MVAWGCKDLEIAIDCRDALGSHGPSLVTMDGVAIRINCSEHLAQHHHQSRNHGCTRRVVCVRVPVDRFGHVLCRLPLEHVTAARHVLCCGALSCRRPVGRAAGCGSRMRQQDATADGVGKVTILAIWTKQRESTATRHARVQSARRTVRWSSMGNRSPRLAQRFAGGRSQSTPDRGWSSLTRTMFSGQGHG